MVEGGGGASFPVIFFDGQCEIKIGNIQVHPMLDYKAFQWLLSQRIGISPNQISIYQIERKNSKTSEDRRKVPITGKTNFADICRGKNIYFLVVLKRSRKSRTRRARANVGDYPVENEFSLPPQPENVTILRRDRPHEADYLNSAGSGLAPPFYDLISTSELASLNQRLQNLRVQRENYATVMGKSNLNPNDFPKVEDYDCTMTMTKRSHENVHSCKYCEIAEEEGDTKSFHHCVNDDMVVGFRSRAGPVGWPLKSSC